MTATNDTQYYICTSTYHGADLYLLNNGDTVRITTSPLYSEEEQRTICNDWGCAQYGPFSTIEEARQEMTRLYGPCREIDDDDPDWDRTWKETYRIGEYEILTKDQIRELYFPAPAPDMTDAELEEDAANMLDWLHTEGESADLDDIKDVITEMREYARERAGYDNED